MATRKQSLPRPSYERAIALLADLHDQLSHTDEVITVISALYHKSDIVVMFAVIAERSIRAMQAPNSNVKPLKKA